MMLHRHVRKRSGYKWPGVVVAEFVTLAGEKRLVVECTAPEVAGALHIFRPDQIEADQDQIERLIVGLASAL
jgi:hypothetical protein